MAALVLTSGTYCPTEIALFICDSCGEVIAYPSMAVCTADGNIFCDEDCAEAEGYRYCSQCGMWGIDDAGIETDDGEWFCTTNCAYDFGYRECERCGTWSLEENCIETGDLSYYCDADCAHNDGYEQCERCGNWFYADEGYVFECNGELHCYCDYDCAERDGFVQCEHCGDWVAESDTVEVRRNGGYYPWCESCFDSYAFRCDECGDYFHRDDVIFDEDTDEYYCSRCHERLKPSVLHEYGWTPRIQFFPSSTTALFPLFLGVELETDGGYERAEYCQELADISKFTDHFWMTQDSSLDNGVEITSHPMTLAYHVAMRGIYQEISHVAINHRFRSHDGGRCGLHVHVNRNFFGKSETVQDAGGLKVMRLLQRFEHAFTVFSRRQDNHWCSYKTSRDYSPKEKQPHILNREGEQNEGVLPKARQMKGETSHAQALNFQHYNTFEFRIFRGTLKWSTYYACLGLVDGICRVAKSHGLTWCESVTWYDLIGEIVDRCSDKYAKECLVRYLDEKSLR